MYTCRLLDSCEVVATREKVHWMKLDGDQVALVQRLHHNSQSENKKV